MTSKPRVVPLPPPSPAHDLPSAASSSWPSRRVLSLWCTGILYLHSDGLRRILFLSVSMCYFHVTKMLYTSFSSASSYIHIKTCVFVSIFPSFRFLSCSVVFRRNIFCSFFCVLPSSISVIAISENKFSSYFSQSFVDIHMRQGKRLYYRILIRL